MAAAATAAQIKSALAPVLKQDEADVADFWDGICEQAELFASNTVRDALLIRGFSAANVSGWDRLYEFTLDLGLWKAVNLGGAYDVVPKDTRDALDRREELHGSDKVKAVLVFVGGEPAKPAGDRPGQAAGAGPTVAQASGVFRFSDDPDDVDHGIQI